MPIQLRLAAIAAAAIIAAAAHRHHLARQLETGHFIAVSRALQFGATLTEGDLEPVTLASPRKLETLLIPWSYRQDYVGRVVARDYSAGELLVGRDMDQTALDLLTARPGEYLFKINLTMAREVQDSFQIHGVIGFLVRVPKSPGSTETKIVECGPFTLEGVGAVTKQIDRRLMQSVTSGTVALSTRAQPGKAIPDLALMLMEANDGSSIVGLYYPEVPPSTRAN